MMIVPRRMPAARAKRVGALFICGSVDVDVDLATLYRCGDFDGCCSFHMICSVAI